MAHYESGTHPNREPRAGMWIPLSRLEIPWHIIASLKQEHAGIEICGEWHFGRRNPDHSVTYRIETSLKGERKTVEITRSGK